MKINFTKAAAASAAAFFIAALYASPAYAAREVVSAQQLALEPQLTDGEIKAGIFVKLIERDDQNRLIQKKFYAAKDQFYTACTPDKSAMLVVPVSYAIPLQGEYANPTQGDMRKVALEMVSEGTQAFLDALAERPVYMQAIKDGQANKIFRNGLADLSQQTQKNTGLPIAFSSGVTLVPMDGCKMTANWQNTYEEAAQRFVTSVRSSRTLAPKTQ